MLPRAPQKVDTARLEEALSRAGLSVHRRTLQRDLLELAEVFPIAADDRSKPYGWRWMDPARPTWAREPPPPALAPPTTVTLRGPRAILEEALSALGVPRARIAEDGRDPRLAVASVALDGGDRARRVLFSYTGDLEVLSPPHLRQEIVERLRRALAAHEARL